MYSAHAVKDTADQNTGKCQPPVREFPLADKHRTFRVCRQQPSSPTPSSFSSNRNIFKFIIFDQLEVSQPPALPVRLPHVSLNASLESPDISHHQIISLMFSFLPTDLCSLLPLYRPRKTHLPFSIVIDDAYHKGLSTDTFLTSMLDVYADTDVRVVHSFYDQADNELPSSCCLRQKP